MKIKISKIHENAVLPKYAHGPDEDAGMDLQTIETVTLEPLKPCAVRTGLCMEIPSGFEVQLRPRSGLAVKHAITLANSPATIDPSYRGEVKVILINLGHAAYEVTAGDRIAQMVVARYEAVEWSESEVAELATSARGEGGLGSTGR